MNVKPKELADLYRQAEAEGCTLSLSGGDHIAVLLPSGRTYFGPQTASDRRSVLNARATMRRMGLELKR